MPSRCISPCLVSLSFLLMALPGRIRADTPVESPEGLWKTIDDKSGKTRSIVALRFEDGRLMGRVERLFREKGENPDPVCVKCRSDRKDQPVLGMRILWDLVADGEGWGGGYILDPESGKIYRCQVRLLAGGGKLEVRGYIGMPLVGRSQVWVRWSGAGP